MLGEVDEDGEIDDRDDDDGDIDAFDYEALEKEARNAAREYSTSLSRELEMGIFPNLCLHDVGDLIFART